MGCCPYLIISQTVPLIALGPLVVSWGGKRRDLGGWDWPRWLSVAVLGAFLAFFPVAVGDAARPAVGRRRPSLELMDSYAAIVAPTLFKLRFPAAVPFLVPALQARRRGRGGRASSSPRSRPGCAAASAA